VVTEDRLRAELTASLGEREETAEPVRLRALQTHPETREYTDS